MTTMKNKLLALALVVFVYNLYFFPLFVPLPGRLSFLLFMATGLAFVWLAFWPNQWQKKEHFAVETSIISLVTALLALQQASPIDQHLLGLLSAGMGGLSAYLLVLDSKLFGGLVEAVLAPVRLSLAWFIHFFAYYSGEH